MVKLRKDTENSNTEALFAEIMNLEQAAWDSKFYIRQPNKITATALFASFFEMHQSGKNTLKSWSTNMSLIIGKSLSEQSLDERLDERAVNLAKTILKTILDAKTNKGQIENKKNPTLNFCIFSTEYSSEIARHKNYQHTLLVTFLAVILMVSRPQSYVCNRCSVLQMQSG